MEGANTGSHQPLKISKNSPQAGHKGGRLLTCHLSIPADDLGRSGSSAAQWPHAAPACFLSSRALVHTLAWTTNLGWLIHCKITNVKFGTLLGQHRGRGEKALALQLSQGSSTPGSTIHQWVTWNMSSHLSELHFLSLESGRYQDFLGLGCRLRETMHGSVLCEQGVHWAEK